jgi:hypothetical protein
VRFGLRPLTGIRRRRHPPGRPLARARGLSAAPVFAVAATRGTPREINERIVRLYHVTTPEKLPLILKDGFKDHAAAKGVPGIVITHRFEPGVWLADVPPITAIRAPARRRLPAQPRQVAGPSTRPHPSRSAEEGRACGRWRRAGRDGRHARCGPCGGRAWLQPRV